MEIEKKEDLPTEQEALQAAIKKHTAALKAEPMQIETTSSWRTYYSHHLKQQIIHFCQTIKPQLPFVAKYNLEPCQNFQCTYNGFIFDNIPKYNWSYVKFLSTKFGAKEKEKKEESVVFIDWCYDTDDWPVEETLPASEEWSELVTESETATWNLPDMYT
ncbi:20533_t:CDS:2 [Gigaspora margarita]|uniref:20533_t:CDS:1 n=1 Tax=Gigaspora margarita TaxID=4874 RepID=A0ABN7UU44_GIGMA|nr:20533_t:CDS:2 [Gigaspora margarita]